MAERGESKKQYKIQPFRAVNTKLMVVKFIMDTILRLMSVTSKYTQLIYLFFTMLTTSRWNLSSVTTRTHLKGKGENYSNNRRILNRLFLVCKQIAHKKIMCFHLQEQIENVGF